MSETSRSLPLTISTCIRWSFPGTRFSPDA
jgi:hypothetical protein